MVTRSDRNEVRFAETERWAAPSRGRLPGADRESIDAAAGDNVVVLRWDQAVLSSVPTKFRVGVEVLRFEGAVGGTVDFRARYTIHDMDGKALSVKESTVQERASGPDYDALAAAMSRTLASASKEIADVVRAK
jgi:uncharacterized lipoprotein YmbA